MLRTVMETALQRACVCEAEDGAHLRDIIFLT